jgi:hypothetical protein
MSNNLEPGCLATIIKSVEGAAVGQVVQCVAVVGSHSLYGTMWEIRSKDTLVTEYGGVGHTGHIPAKWLRKIKPDELPKVTDRLKELEQ